MEIIETSYKITKDEGFIGKRFDTYTIEKTLILDNGKKEFRYKTWIPFRDGDINKVNLDTLIFPKPITEDEWVQLPQEYRTAWLKGTMTEELSKYGLSVLQQIRERKFMEENRI